MPACVTVVLAFSFAGYFARFHANAIDFRAFYCAGQAVGAGADPYREHPLHECERALPAGFVSADPPAQTIPAPLPGYDLAVFGAVARLPFVPALALWTLGAACALAASAILVARLTGAPPVAAAIAVGFIGVTLDLPLGQVTPYVLVAVGLCGVHLRAGRPRAAALAALATLADPHAGVAVCVGVFAGVPAARNALTCGLLVLAAASVVAIGPALTLEYVRDVLPLHARVNLAEFSQYSASNLALTAGVAPRAALLLGHLWYGGAVVAGTVVALRLRARLGVAAIALIPVAFAVFGGSYTHLQQLGLALPAFVLVAQATSGGYRAVTVAATYAACVPWLFAAPIPASYLAVAVLGAAFARALRTPGIALALGGASFAILCALCIAVVHAHPTHGAFASPAGNPLAEVAWGAFVKANFVPAQAWFVLAKIPTLLAFTVLLGTLVAWALESMWLAVLERRIEPAPLPAAPRPD